MELVNEFKALADETRLRITALLSVEKLCVCEIMDILNMNQPRISRHLGILKQAGLIEEARKGKWVIYRFADAGSIILAYIKQKIENDPAYTVDAASLKKTLRKKLCPSK